jgi:hypothetical protein
MAPSITAMAMALTSLPSPSRSKAAPLAVHLGELHLPSNGLALREESEDQPCHTIPSTNRLAHRNRFSSTMACEHGILREQSSRPCAFARAEICRQF